MDVSMVKPEEAYNGYKELAAAILELAVHDALDKERKPRGMNLTVFYHNMHIHTARRLLFSEEDDFRQYRNHLMERCGLNCATIDMKAELEKVNSRRVPLDRWDKYPEKIILGAN